jgi:hypothetical protein
MSGGPAPSPEALEALRPMLRQLREIKGLAEARPGVVQRRGKPFATVVATGAGLLVELAKPGGSGADRLPADTPPQQRKVVDEARLRAKRLDDED